MPLRVGTEGAIKTPRPAPCRLVRQERQSEGYVRQTPARELYGRRFAQAKSSSEKTAVAKEMLEAGETLPKGSADQYAVWKIARDVATVATSHA